jgi:hypothetical protein
MRGAVSFILHDATGEAVQGNQRNTCQTRLELGYDPAKGAAVSSRRTSGGRTHTVTSSHGVAAHATHSQDETQFYKIYSHTGCKHPHSSSGKRSISGEGISQNLAIKHPHTGSTHTRTKLVNRSLSTMLNRLTRSSSWGHRATQTPQP